MYEVKQYPGLGVVQVYYDWQTPREKKQIMQQALKTVDKMRKTIKETTSVDTRRRCIGIIRNNMTLFMREAERFGVPPQVEQQVTRKMLKLQGNLTGQERTVIQANLLLQELTAYKIMQQALKNVAKMRKTIKETTSVDTRRRCIRIIRNNMTLFMREAKRFGVPPQVEQQVTRKMHKLQGNLTGQERTVIQANLLLQELTAYTAQQEK